MERGKFQGRTLLLVNGAGKHHGWRLKSYAYVGAEQVLGELNAYDKDSLCEYHYRFCKCFESARITTDAELCVLMSKRNENSIDFGSEIYILSSTMETFVALK